MASTYSDSLKLELMETGANAATWGTNTNTNLEVLDAFTQGYVSKSVAGSANITLSTGNADPNAEAANKVIELTGALTGDIVVFIPAVTGGSEYLFFNNTSGSQTLTIAATGHTANGAIVTQGAYSRVYCDGTPNFNVKIQTSLLGAVTTKGAAVFDAGATVTAGQDLTAGSGAIIARSNGQVSATLFTGSGDGLTNLPAANLAGTIANISGANLTNLPAANLAGTISQISGQNLTTLNAANVSSGTLNSDRLGTVPTTKGGTGLTSLGSAGQVLTVTAPGSAVAFESISAGGGYSMSVFTGSGTYTKPAGLAALRVRVLGGGGGGGGNNPPGNTPRPGAGGGLGEKSIQAGSVGATETVTVGGGGGGGGGREPGSSGGTSSFGSHVSASGGGGGGGGPSTGSYGTGGIGSGGQVNMGGNYIQSSALSGRRNTTTGGSNSGTGGFAPNYYSTGQGGDSGIVIVEEFS